MRCRSIRVGQTAFHRILKEASQRLSIEGLAQYSQISGSGLRSIAVPSRKDHWQIRIPHAHFMREANPVDRPRHDNVAEEKINVRAFRQELQRRFS